MARHIYQKYAVDGNGNIVTDATISVYDDSGATTPSSIYVAASGGSAVNSVTSHATTGLFTFYVDEADYTLSDTFYIKITKPNYSFDLIGPVSIFDISTSHLALSSSFSTEHNSDGTHKIPVSETVKSADQSLIAAALTWEDVTELQVTLPSIGTYDIEIWLRADVTTDAAANTGTADLFARLYNVTKATNVGNSQVFLIRADRPSNSLTIKRANTTYWKHSVTTTQVNEVVKVQAYEVDINVTLATKIIASNITGRSKIRYTRVS